MLLLDFLLLLLLKYFDLFCIRICSSFWIEKTNKFLILKITHKSMWRKEDEPSHKEYEMETEWKYSKVISLDELWLSLKAKQGFSNFFCFRYY